MNPPQVYMCSSSWTILPPRTIPLGRPSAPAPSIQYRASNLDWRLVSYMILYMFQCHSPKSSHPLPLPESKRLFYASVSLLLSRIQGYCYHLSKFHIYAHWLDGRESEWTPGVGDGQGGLACCNSWGCKESDTTERLIWSDTVLVFFFLAYFTLYNRLQFHPPH